MQVSIIMPAYNSEGTLAQSIESVLNQTFAGWELLIVDDGSEDSTFEIASCYAAQDARIRVIRQENRGVAGARNRALAEVCGDLIAFLDSDDLWRQDKLEKQIVVFELDDRIGLCYTDKLCFVTDIYSAYPCNTMAPVTISDEQLRLLVHDYIGTLTVMVRRTAIESAGVFDETLFGTEDWDMWIRVSRMYRIYHFPEALAYYREHSQGISKNKQRHLKEKYKVMQKHLLSSEAGLPRRYVGEAMWLFYREHAVYHFIQKRYVKAFGFLLKSFRYAPMKKENFLPAVKLMHRLARRKK